MNTKRILLLLIAVVLVWFAFFRKKALPQAVAINRPATPASAANNATAQTIKTVSNAAQPYVAQLTGWLFNGVAQSIGSYGQGGSSGADTGSTSDWGDFESYDDFADFGETYSGTGGEF
jgi:hypothetical protein